MEQLARGQITAYLIISEALLCRQWEATKGFCFVVLSKGVTWSDWSFDYITQVILEEVTETGEESVKYPTSEMKWAELKKYRGEELRVGLESHLESKIKSGDKGIIGVYLFLH